MNRKIFVVAAALALAGAQAMAQGGGAGSGTGSSGNSSAGQAQGQSMATSNEVSGRVALVNATDRELAIDSGSATTQVKVAPDAKITIDGKSAALKDIKQGASVRASLDRSGDDVQAKKVEVTSGGKKK
jgi:hypothetical protein